MTAIYTLQRLTVANYQWSLYVLTFPNLLKQITSFFLCPHPTLDTAPPPVAPFNHRIVSAKPNLITNFYTISWQEILGGWVLYFSSNLHEMQNK